MIGVLFILLSAIILYVYPKQGARQWYFWNLSKTWPGPAGRHVYADKKCVPVFSRCKWQKFACVFGANADKPVIFSFANLYKLYLF